MEYVARIEPVSIVKIVDPDLQHVLALSYGETGSMKPSLMKLDVPCDSALSIL